MALSVTSFESQILENARNVWFQPAADVARHQGVLLILDAEHYLDDIGAVEIVAEAQRAASSPRLAVYVSHIDYPTRWRESFCNPDFAAFLATELLPWIVGQHDVGSERTNAVLGVSLTGLAAAHAALLHPTELSSASCQSGSFWWQNGWLIDEVPRLPTSDVNIALSVGTKETKQKVDHGDGLLQNESQLSSNRRMRDALAKRGLRHSYREFDGGHDLASFRRDLPDALACLAPSAVG